MELAYRVTENFCYGCYKVVEGSHCPECHSDDFMRHLDGVGVEYGTEWVIESLIKEHCTAIDEDELYDQMLDECYPDFEMGYSSWTASEVLKELDPTGYRVGKADYFGSDDETYKEIDGDYYLVSDIEEMIETL